MRRGQGFTLLEVMIAVAFIAVAAVAVLRTQGQGLLLAEQARFTARAVFLARQVLNETHAQDDLLQGNNGEAFPDPLSDFKWERRVTPVSGFPGLYRVKITVLRGEQPDGEGVKLTGFTYREPR
jgi:prepilin-type N-terminal cleavage/methylation domain-containing protein